MPNPNFLIKEDVLLIHADQIQSFGGSLGLRDEGLLNSALAQPQAMFDGVLLHPTICEQAAAYLYHLAMNHPFIDGNKRTAFAVMDTFLRVNGYELTLSNDEAYDLVMAVVNQQVSKPDLIAVLQAAVKGSGGGDSAKPTLCEL
ncbi:type II toxin-antitoxin system death-on-curing family toxin [Thermostichus vulcanus]|uniref:Type II toxin-antitoxin system death-on-curing family toxin n=1 Tax=Thermostichus vulcanus str. 'Rupite' TaxID=2813851 RepID=A0ABT0C8L8_THEVL|nr:type II toxin-antitoxin system death-on-curing family toxin [Thermostichus vulcanus]MCJ2542139.1 type II toxin-antitoxin system death-on-curing family toxin [Thermostichus vulcanus str. 'Rupite']